MVWLMFIGCVVKGSAITNSFFGEETGGIFLYSVGCSGSESRLLDCYHPDFGLHTCDHTQGAGVRCYTPGSSNCTDGEVRLLHGMNERKGTVEICIQGVWGTICDSSWDSRDADVVCRQLGFTTFGAIVHANGNFSRENAPILFDDYVDCNGDENNLLDCNSYQLGCNDNHFIDIECSAPVTDENCTNGDIRLMGGSTELVGRVEFCYDHQWGTVCDDHWSNNDAIVVCRQLGYPPLESSVSHSFGGGIGGIFLDAVVCSGMESKLVDCSHNEIGVHRCDHTHDVGVRCSAVPCITGPPENQSIVAGTRVVFSCIMEPPAEVQWRYKGMNLESEGRYIVTRDNAHGSLVVVAASQDLVGEYTCFVSNDFGFDMASAWLTVQDPPFFSTNPLNATLSAQSDITLSCSATGIPLPQITWLKDGMDISDLYNNASEIGRRIVTSSNDSSTHSILYLTEVDKNDTATYSCRAANDLASVQVVESFAAQLQVQYPPDVTTALQDKLKNESETLKLFCQFLGFPAPGVEWTKKNLHALTSNERITISTKSMYSPDLQLYLTNSTLEITSLQSSDEAEYTCTAENGVQNLFASVNRSSAFVTVQVPPTVMAVGGASIIGFQGRKITLSFVITRASPEVEPEDIQWSYTNGSAGITGDLTLMLESQWNVTVETEMHYTFSEDELSLTIINLQINDAGLYTLSSRNPAGYNSAFIILTVYAEPEFYNTETGSDLVLTREEGQSVTFHCTADGIPVPEIIWISNGRLVEETLNERYTVHEDILGGVYYRQMIPDSRHSILTISELSEADSGEYLCRADIGIGQPAILPEPFKLTVRKRLMDYCGLEPCQNGGMCFSGQSSYLCVCTAKWNGRNCTEGVINDSQARIILPPQSTVQRLYTPVNLTCIATGIPQPSITWFKNGHVISGQRQPFLYFHEIQIQDKGFYHCRAMNNIRRKDDPTVTEWITDVSEKVLLNIKGIVQYKAILYRMGVIEPATSHRRSKRESESSSELDALMFTINAILAGTKLTENASVFSMELHDGTSDHLSEVPVVVTVLSEDGGSHEIRVKLDERLITLTKELGDFNVTFSEVQRFDGCASEETVIPSMEPRGMDIVLLWPETDIGLTEEVMCPCGNISLIGGAQSNASRYCGGNFTTGAMWDDPLDKACNFSETARRLCHISEIEDPEEAVEELEMVTEVEEMIGSLEVTITATLLEELTMDVTELQDRILTETFLGVVDNIVEVDPEELQDSQETANASARILETVQIVTESIPIDENETQVIIPLNSFAVSVQEVKLNEFQGQTFSALFGMHFEFEKDEEIHEEDLVFEEHPEATASIIVPATIFMSVPPVNINMRSSIRIIYSVFLTDTLFTRRNKDSLKVGSIIISAAISGDFKVKGLQPPIMLSFAKKPELENGTSTICSFWDPALDGGFGNWSSKGCLLVNDSKNEAMCECDHLTNFAILLDVSPKREATPTDTPTEVNKTLQAVSYLGAIISICCLLLTITTYLSSKNLRTSEASQLLIQLCFGYLGIYVMYIIAFYSIAVTGLCVLAGALVQYFMLVTFIIMAAEATNLFMKLVLVFAKIHKYVVKVGILAWVLPIFIVIPCVAPNYRNYIGINFCRPYDIPFYVGLLVPFALIYIFNWSMFFIIMVSLIWRQRKSKRRSSTTSDSRKQLKQSLLSAITLSLLFGLEWGFGLPATSGVSNHALRVTSQALFIVLTAFQGLFIFIMHCLVGNKSLEVRKEWKRWLYYVTCRRELAIQTRNTSLTPKYTITNTLTRSFATGSDTLRKINMSSSLALEKTTSAASGYESSSIVEGKHSINSPELAIEKDINQLSWVCHDQRSQVGCGDPPSQEDCIIELAQPEVPLPDPRGNPPLKIPLPDSEMISKRLHPLQIPLFQSSAEVKLSEAPPPLNIHGPDSHIQTDECFTQQYACMNSDTL